VGSFAGGTLELNGGALTTVAGGGTVTGGLGGYKGATGSVTISPGPNQNSTKITITYQV